MLRDSQPAKVSRFSELYEYLIPRDHFLRRFNDLVDLSFIHEELRDKYSLENGRNAISPVMLFKYLLLKVIYNMSDMDLVERSRYDMSFKYFLGLCPEDDVIHPSTLTKFRKLRLKDENLLDLLIQKSIQIALAKNVIKSDNIIVDATHTKARYNRKSAYECLLEQAKALRKVVYQIDSPARKEHFPKKIENGMLEDALEYCRKLIIAVDSDHTIAEIPAIREKLNLLKEMVDDNVEHLVPSVDKDARVGHKTADTSFFGYKTHIAMTDERIITAATVTSGEHGDGEQLEALVEKTRKAGLNVKSVIGDTAYSGKRNLELAESRTAPDKSFELIAKLNPVISNSMRDEKENGFIYNKDAGMFVCPAGHMAIRKTKHTPTKKGKNVREVYYFDIEKCKHCPQNKNCYKDGTKSKTYSVTIKCDLHKKQEEFQKTEYFKNKANNRYMIEAKNSELKHRHGYDVASFSGLVGMELQGATTLFVVNIKRIMKLISK